MSPSDAGLRIVFVASDYPSVARSHVGTFVHSLAKELRSRGTENVVVSPRPAGRTALQNFAGIVNPDELPDPGAEMILRPWYPSFSNLGVAGFSTFRATVASYGRAVERATRNLTAPSVVYGHFLFPAGAAALRVARRWGRPCVAALGESSLEYYRRHMGVERTRRTIDRFDAVLSVSEEIRDHCVEELGVPAEKIEVIPNTADTTVFRPRDRRRMRAGLNLPEDDFLVLFVGHFDERKGPRRVLRAIEPLNGVRGIFLGKGPRVPRGEKVAFAGAVPHREVARWMSAADVFVLPTLAEGSPNAIAEAMAAGLPVVSSDIGGVRKMVGPDAGILVDPMNEAEIRAAIEALKSDPGRRASCTDAALLRARDYTLRDRGRKVLDMLEEVVRGAEA